MAAVSLNPETHTYTIDGDVVPSVTQVIQATGLIDTTWMTYDGCIRGGDVHSALEFLDRGTLDLQHIEDVRPELMAYIEAWSKFLGDSKFRVTEIEKLGIAKRPPLYAGTVDRVGAVHSMPTILDIKTGAPRPADAIQIAAYAGMDTTPETLPTCWLVYLHPDRGRGYTLRSLGVSEILEAQNVFAAALTVYNWRLAHGLIASR